MLTVHTTVPAGRYGLMPVVNDSDEALVDYDIDNYSVILEPIRELEGSPADDSDEPEKIAIELGEGGSFTATSNRGRMVDAVLLDVAISCDNSEDMEAFPLRQDTSFQTEFGALTASGDYVLVPVESDRTNPDPEAREAHNWLVFDFDTETQVAVDNGAIVLGDIVLDLVNLLEREAA